MVTMRRPTEQASHHRQTCHADSPDRHEVEDGRQANWTRWRWLLRDPIQRLEHQAPARQFAPASLDHRVRYHEQLGLIGCLAPAPQGQGSCRLHHFSDQGLDARAAHGDANPVHLARAKGSDERALLRVLPRLPALMTVLSLVAGLSIEASMALGCVERSALVRWHRVGDWHDHFERGLLPHGLTGGAAVAFLTGPRPIPDRFSTDPQLLARK